MARWTLRDYETKDGHIHIRDWYDAQDARVQSQFDTTVQILRVTENWTTSKQFKELTKAHAGLGEILFDIDVKLPGAAKLSKRRFRPVGVYRPKIREFIFILGCEKQRGLYIPPGSFDDALKYKAEFEKGLGALHDHYV